MGQSHAQLSCLLNIPAGLLAALTAAFFCAASALIRSSRAWNSASSAARLQNTQHKRQSWGQETKTPGGPAQTSGWLWPHCSMFLHAPSPVICAAMHGVPAITPLPMPLHARQATRFLHPMAMPAHQALPHARFLGLQVVKLLQRAVQACRHLRAWLHGRLHSHPPAALLAACILQSHGSGSSSRGSVLLVEFNPLTW